MRLSLMVTSAWTSMKTAPPKPFCAMGRTRLPWNTEFVIEIVTAGVRVAHCSTTRSAPPVVAAVSPASGAAKLLRNCEFDTVSD